jgi:CheY-like chemotaxis protein
MTLSEFNSLTIEQQADLIENYDGSVSFREDEEHKIILKKIDNFFVEVYYKFLQYDRVAKIRSFDTIEQLLPWVFKKHPKGVDPNKYGKNCIVQLEDQELYSKSIQHIITTAFPGINYRSFKDVWMALQFIMARIERGKTIDLIITDFNHPGINGYRFAKLVREMERGTNIPIILLTMMNSQNHLIQEGQKEMLFNSYLHKSSSGEDILAAVSPYVILKSY